MIRHLIVAAALLPAFQETPRPEAVFVTLGVSTPGGFVPAERVLFLEFIPAAGTVTVRRTVRKEEAETATLDPAAYDALIKDIATVWDLPTENPKDGEDIYGMNTGIQLRRGSRSWVNGAPSGCIHMASTVKPTDAQRREFARVVERIKAAVESVLPTTRIQLTVGFAGGKQAPRRDVHITFEPAGETVKVRRTIKAPSGKTDTYDGVMTARDYDALVQSIAGISGLPVEHPRDGEDIYQMDVGILVSAGGRTWRNCAPGGCIHTESTIQPSAAQRDQFAKYVEAILKEAEKRATTKQ